MPDEEERVKILPLVLCGALFAMAPAQKVLAADAAATDEERAARWENDCRVRGFGHRKIEPTETLIKLDAPQRAQDAALMPVTLIMPEKDKIKSVYLVIDDNPSPLAAHVTFGPAADPAACYSSASGSIPTPICTPWPRPGTAGCSGPSSS